MVTINPIQHREAPGIGKFFDFGNLLKQSARRTGTRWSQMQKCWYVDYSNEGYQKIKQAFAKNEIIKSTDQKVPQPAPGLQNNRNIAYKKLYASYDTALIDWAIFGGIREIDDKVFLYHFESMSEIASGMFVKNE